MKPKILKKSPDLLLDLEDRMRAYMNLAEWEKKRRRLKYQRYYAARAEGIMDAIEIVRAVKKRRRK